MLQLFSIKSWSTRCYISPYNSVVFRYPGCRTPVVPVIPAGTVVVRMARGCQVTIIMLMSGVPQVSVLGPILFIMYTADLVSVTESHGLSPHMYADDIQVYGSCRPAAVDDFSLRISACVGAVSSWMKSNRLSLNCDKSEVLWCASCRRQHQLPSNALSIDGTLVEPVKSVCDLGIYIDSDLLMRTHVQHTVSRCFVVLRQLRQIRRSVPTDTFQSLVVSLVLTRLDFGNSVLAGLPVYLVRRLQSVLNAAARLMYHLRRSDHITDALVCLHWLRVLERVQF